jgi:4'-phosphopantetheinyl transferase EntD
VSGSVPVRPPAPVAPDGRTRAPEAPTAVDDVPTLAELTRRAEQLAADILAHEAVLRRYAESPGAGREREPTADR